MRKRSNEGPVAGSDGNYMTKQNLWLVHRVSGMLYEGLPDGVLLPDWAESKINSAAQHLKEVAGWAMHESHGDNLHPPPEANPIHLAGEGELRSRVIRLAHTNPSLRPHLLPLLREASLDKTALKFKEMKRFLDDPRKQFGVLTAHHGGGGAGANTRANEELVRDIQELGYNNFIPLKASWDGTSEKSFLVPGMKFTHAIKLGEKYKQQAVIFKDGSGTLGVYYPSERAVEVAATPDGDIAAEIALDKSPTTPLAVGENVVVDKTKNTNPLNTDSCEQYHNRVGLVSEKTSGGLMVSFYRGNMDELTGEKQFFNGFTSGQKTGLYRKTLYSKGRGLSFSFGVLWGQKMPWDMTRPLKLDDVKAMLEASSLTF